MFRKFIFTAAALGVLGASISPSFAQETKKAEHAATAKKSEVKKPAPKKSVKRKRAPKRKSAIGKTKQFSSNVNHEVNRESKDFNNTMNNASKSINHAFQGKKKKKD